MLDDKLTEIAVVLDRSGSMANIKDDMEGGLWTLVTEQHGMPGRCRVSLYRFDDDFEVAFEGKSSGEITRDDCRLVPRGQTALFDAVVKSLSAVEARILAEAEDARPEIVVVVVITDGKNNASRENTREDARKATDRATTKLGWKFAFLAADADGFDDGHSMAAGAKGTSVGTYDVANVGEAYQRTSRGISDVRSGLAPDVDVSSPLKKPGDDSGEIVH